MSYDSTRDSEQLRILDHSIDDFVNRYNNNSGPANGVRHTVILFPGGMGSCLKRATKRYVASGGAQQIFNYDVVWLDVGSLLGGARDLRMKRITPSRYTDKGDRIVVADGPVRFLGCSPYDGFTSWCDAKGLDWFVYGWDWRRRIEHTGKFFVQKFLPHFRERVQSGCNNADPLKHFSLIGHSAGGPLANWILRDDDAIIAGMHRAITVASPFYGYGGQAHRWFEGEPMLNGAFDVFKSGIVKAICSFPACYTWMYLPYGTYLQNQAALAADPAYPLIAYPSRDLATSGVADPYDPQTNGSQTRYPKPSQTGFDAVELSYGKALVEYLAAPLNPALAQKFVNIVCDTSAGDTVGSTTWDWVPPTQPSPIADGAQVPGDGTMPAWTARHVGLAGTNPNNVIAVKGSDVEHTFAMNSPKTQLALAGVLGVP